MSAGNANPVEVASGTADVQAYTGSGRLFGFSFHETAGTAAAASLILRDGTGATGKIIAVVELVADGSETVGLPGILFTDGVYVDRVAGTTEGAVYIG